MLCVLLHHLLGSLAAKMHLMSLCVFDTSCSFVLPEGCYKVCHRNDRGISPDDGNRQKTRVWSWDSDFTTWSVWRFGTAARQAVTRVSVF